MLILSGQLGNRPRTPELVKGGITAEARQAMDNIGALQANGSSFDKILKCTIMLADIADWPAFNAVYTSYFEAHYPARSAFATSGLALGRPGRGRMHRAQIGATDERPVPESRPA